MIRKRSASLLLIGLTLLLSLCSCAGERAAEDAAAYEGTWYFAKTGVACCFQEGKIYQDDLHAKEGQTLMGIYTQEEDHIEANLAGVGGVHIPHSLYLVPREDGAILCDNATGDGTVYFYQDALAALAAVEMAQASASALPDPAPASILPLLPLEAGTSETVDEGQAADRFVTGAPSDEPTSATGAPAQAAEPSSPAERSAGSTVWVSQTGSKYHSDPSCSGMKNPSQISRTEAEGKGYTPCKRCY